MSRMKAEYKNRYGDTIIFEEIDDNHIKVSSVLELGTWKMTDSELCYSQGGPNISVGLDLGILNKDLEGKIVKKINFDKEVILEI